MKCKNLLKAAISIALLLAVSMTAFAMEKNPVVTGNIYEMDQMSNYDYLTQKVTVVNPENAYGNVVLSGDYIMAEDVDGVPAFIIKDDSLEIKYLFDKKLPPVFDGKDCKIEMNLSKNVCKTKLSEKIGYGAIVLQVSKDKKNWSTVKVLTNAFDAKTEEEDFTYQTSSLEKKNGSFYRLTVVYKLKKTVKKYSEYKEIAEVYEFYASGENVNKIQVQKFNLGEKALAESNDYVTSEKYSIDKDDPHFGWNIGNCSLSGYTDYIKEDNGNVIFLKNVGDQIALSFTLTEDINKLNGDENIYICADKKGYDKEMEIPQQNFGKGTLIVRKTNYQNQKEEPIVYTDFLSGSVSVNADTQIEVFEEGDYEVVLDYCVEYNKTLWKNSKHYYTIRFTFSIRNSNCMVFPFDAETGNELQNSSIAPDGFYLDYANSRYLTVEVVKEDVVKKNGVYSYDVRFNRSAKDGDVYTDEGVYTFTVKNQYTGAQTSKQIYVGDDKVLMAHFRTGLSIEEINAEIKAGASITDDGRLIKNTKPSGQTTVSGARK